jgi:hypothetical protein
MNRHCTSLLRDSLPLCTLVCSRLLSSTTSSIRCRHGRPDGIFSPAIAISTAGASVAQHYLGLSNRLNACDIMLGNLTRLDPRKPTVLSTFPHRYPHTLYFLLRRRGDRMVIFDQHLSPLGSRRKKHLLQTTSQPQKAGEQNATQEQGRHSQINAFSVRGCRPRRKCAP